MRSVVQLYPGPPESGFKRQGFKVSEVFSLKLTETLKLALGAVAQLGERLVCNQEATGSIPVSSTNDLICSADALARE